MAVYKRKESGHWFVKFRIAGITYRRNVPEARTKPQAQRVEVQMREEVYQGTYTDRTKPYTFERFVEEVYRPHARENKRSWKSEEYKLTLFLEFFKGKTLREVSPMLIERFKRERLAGITRYGRTRHPATVNLEIAVLSRIMSLAVENGLIGLNPCRRVKRYRVNNKRTRVLSFEEEKRLLAALTGKKAYIKPMVLLALHTGLRKRAILNLLVSDVDFTRGTIRLRAENNKSKKELIIPMNRVAREVLEEAIANTSDEYVFSYRSGANLSNTFGAFQMACRDAGIPCGKGVENGLVFHDLRHTFNSRLAPDPYLRRDLLGHSTIEQNSDYSHTSFDERQRAVEELESPRIVPFERKRTGT